MGESIKSYRDLIAWQKAYALGITLYHFTAKFPEHERFGMTTTLRRSALLLARQIAEGYGKQNTAMYVQTLRMARGTTYDLDTQIEFAKGLKYASEVECEPIHELITECGKILSGLIRSIEN
jgi:four helix bundle protein